MMHRRRAEEVRRDALAAHRAEAYAPRPTGGAWMAGVVGAGVLLGGDAVLSGFYGWRLRDHLLLLVGLMVGGFIAGVVVYVRLLRQNRYARHVERVQIDADEASQVARDEG